MLQKMKNCAFVGPPFCGAPVQPNTLNMPKPASGHAEFRPSYVFVGCRLCIVRLKFVTLPSNVVVNVRVICRVSYNSGRQSNCTIESVAQGTQQR